MVPALAGFLDPRPGWETGPRQLCVHPGRPVLTYEAPEAPRPCPWEKAHAWRMGMASLKGSALVTGPWN